jgi:ketosteroid isomerase-like protein
MKKLVGLLLILSSFFLAISCNNEEGNDHDNDRDVAIDLTQEKLDVSQVLDNLAAATESGNFEMIETIWYSSEDVLLIGTESGQKLEGWDEISAAIKKQFGTFEETLISITDQSIWIHEDASAAWFYEELNYNFVYEEKAMAIEGIRFTGIMQKIDGKWRLIQQHMSVPAELEMIETN